MRTPPALVLREHAIPAIDLDEIFDADFLASLAASLEGSDSSDSLMGSGEGSV